MLMLPACQSVSSNVQENKRNAGTANKSNSLNNQANKKNQANSNKSKALSHSQQQHVFHEAPPKVINQKESDKPKLGDHEQTAQIYEESRVIDELENIKTVPADEIPKLAEPRRSIQGHSIQALARGYDDLKVESNQQWLSFQTDLANFNQLIVRDETDLFDYMNDYQAKEDKQCSNTRARKNSNN